MRLKFILPLFFAALSFTACSSDDDNNRLSEDTLTGIWKLKKASYINYADGDATWKINSDGTIDVVNNIRTTGPEQIYSFLSTGTYNYEALTTGEETSIVIENNSMLVTFNNNDLVLGDSSQSNTNVLTFKR